MQLTLTARPMYAQLCNSRTRTGSMPVTKRTHALEEVLGWGCDCLQVPTFRRLGRYFRSRTVFRHSEDVESMSTDISAARQLFGITDGISAKRRSSGRLEKDERPHRRSRGCRSPQRGLRKSFRKRKKRQSFSTRDSLRLI